MTKRFSVAVVELMFLGLGACSGDGSRVTPAQACSQLVTGNCVKMIECFDPAELAMLGITDQASCEAWAEPQLASRAGGSCSNATTTNLCEDANAVFYPEQVDTCVSEVAALSCADFINGTDSVCTLICQ